MASSQVEIAPSSPFGCVLKDHNKRKEKFREGNSARVNFDKNLKELVRGHIHGSITIYDENSLCLQHDRNNVADVPMITPGETRILDKWAAKQGEEMVSVIERQSHEAEMLAQSSNSLSSVGAASLVQMWEARFSHCKNIKSTSGPNMEPAEPSSPNSVAVNENDTEESAARIASIANQDESSNINNDNNSNGDDDADNNNSDNENASERERVKVADIIRRLKLGDQAQAFVRDDCNDQELSASNTPQMGETASAMMDGTEHTGTSSASQSRFPGIRTPTSLCASFLLEERKLTNTPRLRGRQAFHDLLMQMERDRHMELSNLIERRAVSNFSQKGRIQSMLRLRLLQRGLAAVQEDYQRSYYSRTASAPNRTQGFAITHLRTRFDSGGNRVEQQNSAVVNSTVESSPSGGRVVSTRDDSETLPPPNLLSNDNREEVNIIDQHRPPTESDASEDHNDESRLFSDATWQGGLEVRNLDTQETEGNFWEEEVNEDEVPEADAPQDMEIQYDWISDISRPRSYWEDRRLEWYRETLNSHSVNEDIRQLLQRGTVSSFLISDFREKMDQLMTSRVNLRTQLDHEGNEGQESEDLYRTQQIMASLQRPAHSAGQSEEVQELDHQQDLEEEVEEEHEDEEQQVDEEREENSIAQGYSEVIDYYDQTQPSPQLPAQSPLSSWSSYRDLEIGDDSDQAASTSNSRHPQPEQSYFQVTGQGSSSSTNCPSIEMELISNLRWQMEQLHQEMSELRRSITSCMDMQAKLQQSFKQESRPGHSRYGKRPFNKVAKKKKGSCCICYEMAVDSLLYRCGHMCTCLKCAHELQWGSGKCPICRAPIVDVVRAYADES